jgi:hypothetical protein
MQYSHYRYSDAVHFAANQVLAQTSFSPQSRTDQLCELLYSLAPTIPETWPTLSRGLLARREPAIEIVIDALGRDLQENTDSSRYLVLSSVLMLALTIKQLG